MRIDEIIDPGDTCGVLAHDLEMLAHRAVPPPEARPLSYGQLADTAPFTKRNL